MTEPSPRSDGRRLSALDATLLVMGGIVGVGIFVTPRIVAERVSEPWAFLALWVFGGVIALCAAFTFAELGGSFPRAGGWFVFLREAWGRFAAFLFAWVVLFVVSTGATATMAIFCADMLHRALPTRFGAGGSVAHRVVSVAIIVLVTALTMTGAKRSAWLQNVCMVTKLLAIAGLVLAGLLLVDGGGAPPPVEVPLERPPLFEGMIAALLPLFFSYGGWQMICYVAPEVRDAQRVLPRAIVVGVASVIAIYVALNFAYLRGLGLDGMAADPGFAAQLARAALGETGERWLAAGMAVSALGVCAVTIIASPWLYVAMARERLFFESFGRLHPVTGAPMRALTIQAIVTLVYLFVRELSFLVDSVVFVEWFFHGLVALALIRLRKVRPELPRPFRSPLFPLAPVLYAVTALLIVSGTLWQASWDLKLSGLGTIALGVLVYRPWRALCERAARREPIAPA